jgi:hypothetical protein
MRCSLHRRPWVHCPRCPTTDESRLSSARGLSLFPPGRTCVFRPRLAKQEATLFRGWLRRTRSVRLETSRAGLWTVSGVSRRSLRSLLNQPEWGRLFFGWTVSFSLGWLRRTRSVRLETSRAGLWTVSGVSRRSLRSLLNQPEWGRLFFGWTVSFPVGWLRRTRSVRLETSQAGLWTVSGVSRRSLRSLLNQPEWGRSLFGWTVSFSPAG